MSTKLSSPLDKEPLTAQPAVDPEYRTIDLRGVLVLLWRQQKIVFAFAVGGALIAILAALLTHPGYDATVRLMPPTPKATLISSLVPTRTSGDMYLGLISSRTVTDDVIEHQHLKEYFHTTKPSELRRLLNGMAKITVDKDQFVTVRVRAHEPETALRIANEFPDALYRLNHSVALSGAAHRWEYYEGPLEQEKNNLVRAEEELKAAQQKTGMVMPEAQVRLGVGAIADLQQQIASREEQLAALEAGSTEQNPRVIQLKSQIASLYGQVHRLEEQNGGVGKPSSSAIMPELTLEVMRKQREVKFHETLFEILSRQYENARIDDSYSPPVELVDRAVLPDEKSWPPRKLFAILGFALGGLLGIAYVSLAGSKLPQLWREALTENKAPARADAVAR